MPNFERAATPLASHLAVMRPTRYDFPMLRIEPLCHTAGCGMMGLWVGSYAAEGGEGLYPLSLHDGRYVAGQPEICIPNASFAVWSERHRVTYFVNEQEQGRVTAWHYDTAWHPLEEVPSGGELPCYLALSADERWLACANYGDGSITVLRLDEETGAPAEQVASFRPSGRGCDPERQEGPHAHCVLFADNDQALYHVDLGLDCVFRHALQDGRIVSSDVAFSTPPGSGPRHLAFHPSGHALLICELSATLLLLRREGHRFKLLQSIPTAPEPCEKNLGGHLAVDNNASVLVTNRGHNSLVRFELRSQALERSGWQYTGGSSPRHLHVRDGLAIVAHEEGGGVTQVPVSPQAEPTQHLASIPGAAFILRIPD